MIKLKFINLNKFTKKQKFILCLTILLVGAKIYDHITSTPKYIIEQTLESTNLLSIKDNLFDFYSICLTNTNCNYRLYKINKDGSIEYKDFTNLLYREKNYDYFFLEDIIQKDKSK